MGGRIRDALPLLIMLAFAITCITILNRTGVVNLAQIEQVSVWVKSLGIAGVLLYILAYILRPLIFFPAAPLTLFGGYTFGALQGTVYDIMGAGTGALLA